MGTTILRDAKYLIPGNYGSLGYEGHAGELVSTVLLLLVFLVVLSPLLSPMLLLFKLVL